MTRVSRSGILVVDKPAGATSFDMVARLRRRLSVRRVGHGGTLDPAASGVLPLLIGEATKLVPYLADEDKEYVATIRFGVTTDTQDLTGRVLSTAAVPALSRERLRTATGPFVGRIRQVPPMFSALHHQGRRLYELAREGVEVEREPRDVVVHEIGGPRKRARLRGRPRATRPHARGRLRSRDRRERRPDRFGDARESVGAGAAARGRPPPSARAGRRRGGRGGVRSRSGDRSPAAGRPAGGIPQGSRRLGADARRRGAGGRRP